MASLRQILTRSIPLLAATFFWQLASSQTCYYPDGQTIASNHTACSTEGTSACCSSSAFCMENGLCFEDGIVSRGSCTDKEWNGTACASTCLTQDTSTSLPISPCTTGENATFVCGLNATECSNSAVTFTMTETASGLVLRASQVESLLSSVISSSNTTSNNKTYTSSDMAGLGCGLGLPLFFALCLAIYLLYQEKQKHAPPKLMYPLPDDCKDDWRLQPPAPTALSRPYTPQSANSWTAGSSNSRRGSLGWPGDSKEQQGQVGTFFERYKTMQATDKFGSTQRHELDTLAPQPRYELGDHRFSK